MIKVISCVPRCFTSPVTGGRWQINGVVAFLSGTHARVRSVQASLQHLQRSNARRDHTAVRRRGRIVPDMVCEDDSTQNMGGSPKQESPPESLQHAVWGMLCEEDEGDASRSPGGDARMMAVIMVVFQELGLTASEKTTEVVPSLSVHSSSITALHARAGGKQ